MKSLHQAEMQLADRTVVPLQPLVALLHPHRMVSFGDALLAPTTTVHALPTCPCSRAKVIGQLALAHAANHHDGG